jgi:hypothetical protein
VEVYNAAAAEYLWDAKGLSEDECAKLEEQCKQRGGHILAIGDPVDPDQQGSWSGHLVTLVDGFLLDLSLVKFSRPQKQLELGPVAVQLMHSAPWLDLARITGLVRADGAAIIWYANPGNLRYQVGRAAQPETRAATVDILVNLVRNALRSNA